MRKDSLMSNMLLKWLLTASVVAIAARTASCQDVPSDITQSLMTLLNEETRIRIALDQRMTELADDIATMQALQSNVTCQCAGHQMPVAFSATLTTDIASLGYKQQIPFDKIISNIGGGYDSRHGEFRAPVDGTYEFSVSMLQQSGHWAGVELVLDGQAIGKARTGDSQDYRMATAVVTVEMKAGQDVWVEHIPESDSNTIYGQYFSTFSGHLIQV